MSAVMNNEILKKLKQDYIYQNFKSLEYLYENQLFCDLTLVSKDEMEFKVHKSVVYSASGYFKGIYLTGMKESVADRIHLDFISGKMLELIISFIYIAKLKTDSSEEIQEVAEQSDYLQIDRLRDLCLLFLENLIDDSNCLKLWRLANRLLVEKFKETCIAYILQFSEKLFENSTFLNDLSVDEMKQLLLDSRLPLSQECVFKYALRWARDDIEKFNEVIDCIRFALLSKHFLLSDVLTNKLLMQDKKVMARIIEYATSEWTVEKGEPNEEPLSPPHNTFLAVLGSNVFKLSNSGEFLDPQNGIQFSRRYFAYTNFNQNLFICGGRNSFSGPRTNTCEYYSPQTGKFKYFPPLETGRISHECSSINDKIYVCGGSESVMSIEIFDLGTENWATGPLMTSPRFGFGLTSVNRSLYAVGGSSSKSVEFLDPRSSNSWTSINDEFTPFKYTQCVSIGPEIYCFRTNDHVQIFDTRVNKKRSVNCGYNAVVENGDPFFKISELDSNLGVILPNGEGAKFFKYNTQGAVIFTKEFKTVSFERSFCLSTYCN